MLGRYLAVLVAVGVLLLALPSTSAAIIVPITPFVPPAATMPGSHYPWAQPQTAARAVPCGQPAAWIPTARVLALPLPPATVFAWAQPGAATAPLLHAQPPALIASASSCSVQ